VVSWRYLTIGPGVIVATQPEQADCGTSITNIWDEYFFCSLQSLPQIQAAGPTARWFEHYHGTKDPELDEVFLTAEGRVDWKFGANGANAVTTLFERLIGEPEPDFAATGFEEQMSAAMHAGRSRRM
jgi:hypothetical protein